MKFLALFMAMAVALIASAKSFPYKIDNPEWECRSATFLTVTGVERTSTEFKLHFRARHTPTAWMKVNEAILRNPATGMCYKPVSTVGMQLGEEMWMPQGGEADFTIVYPPLPADVAVIDFIEEGWNDIYGIRLDGEMVARPNYVDPLVWMADHECVYPGDPDQFICEQNAEVSGKINGFDRRVATDNMLFYAVNKVTGVTTPVSVDVADDGSFKASLPVATPTFVMIELPTKLWQLVYVEPGRRLDMLIGWEDIIRCQNDKRFDRNSKLQNIVFGGELGSINKELYAAPDNDMFVNNATGKTYNAAQTKITVELGCFKNIERVNAYADMANVNPLTRKLLKNRCISDAVSELLDFEMFHGFYWKNDSTTASFMQPPSAEFYDFLKDLMLAEKWVLACCNSSLINKLAFTEYFSVLGSQKTFSQSDCATDMPYDWVKNMIREAGLIKELADTDTVPFMWQVVMASKLCSYGAFPQVENVNQGFDFIDNMSAQGAITDAGVLSEMKRYIVDLLSGDGYYLPDTKAGQIMKDIIARHQGKMLLIDFWATTCGPCRSTIERLSEFRNRNKCHPDFKFIFITGDSSSPENAYNSYVKEHLQGEECHRVSESDFNRLRALFKFSGIPHYVLVDRDGKIINDDFTIYNLESTLQKNGITLK